MFPRQEIRRSNCSTTAIPVLRHGHRLRRALGRRDQRAVVADLELLRDRMRRDAFGRADLIDDVAELCASPFR